MRPLLYLSICAIAALLGAMGSHPANASTFARTDDTRPKPPEHWQQRERFGIDIGAGGAYMAGNVEHFAINGSLDLMVRFCKRHQIFVEGRAAHSAFGGNAVIDKDRGSVLVAFGLHRHLNLFLYSTHSRNRFLTLTYRTTNSVGLCLHSWAPEVLELSLVSLGFTPEWEWWDGGEGEDLVPQTAVRGSLRVNLTWPATPFMRLGVDLSYSPVFAAFGDFRVYAEAYIEMKVTQDTVSFRFSVVDEYDSRPRPGVQSNDLTVLPSLQLHLGQ